MLRKICALVLAMALLASAFACTSVQEDSSSETNNTGNFRLLRSPVLRDGCQ